MIEIFVGLIFMIIFGDKEPNPQDRNENDEIIRPILFDNFHNHDYDGGDNE